MIGQTIFRYGAHDDSLSQHALKQITAGLATVEGNKVTRRGNEVIAQRSQTLGHLLHTCAVERNALRYIVIIL